MAKSKKIYCCTECGAESSNWAGRCPKCGAWNTLSEINIDSGAKSGRRASLNSASSEDNAPTLLADIDSETEIRIPTGISELDRVLGGGAVKGSLVLIGGAPGIGKSTVLLQMCGYIRDSEKILYVSGEESSRQLKLRADRLGIKSNSLYILAETDINAIIRSIDKADPGIVIIDSIQTVSDYDSDSSAGSVSQIRECTMRIMRVAKERGITVFIVGHINKEGSIAGPKILEHMVDCVLYFEGDSNTSFRLLRAIKNRYGSTNEIGVFEMTDSGLECVDNPSEILISGRPENTPGTCITCAMEGSRPILAEIQALICSGTYNPSRRSNGIDYNRAAMLLAVTEKRGGIPVSSCDAYINVIGGLSLNEPAADLATVLAIASSYLDKPIGNDIAAIGEVGLSGEIRSVNAVNQRLSEISRLGFKRCIIPANFRSEVQNIPGLITIPVKSVYDAIRTVFR